MTAPPPQGLIFCTNLHVLAVIALITSIALMLWTDRFGRRIIVIAASIICTVTMLIVGIVGQFDRPKPVQNFCIFVACVWSLFNAALGSLGWAFVGEIASQKLRARTAGLAAGISVIFGLTFNTSVPVMRKWSLFDRLTYGHANLDAVDTEGADWNFNTAWLFGSLGLFTIVIVWFYVPEPSKRNTAEMDEMYENGVPAWKMQKYVTNVQRAQQEVLNREPENQGRV